MLLQMSLIMLAEKRGTSPHISMFRMTYFCPSWKRPSPCFQYVPKTVVVLIRQTNQNIHTSREAWTFCQRFRTPYRVRILVELLFLLTRQQKWYYRLQQAQSLIPYNYIPYTGTLVVYSSLYLLSTVLLYITYCLKKNVVVHQSVLVEYYYYCCFHLNYGTTTVGPDIAIRNKKRSLLCAPHPQ